MAKVGIIGTGAVGSNCALCLALRACAQQLILVDQNERKAEAVATDLSHGLPLFSPIDVRQGGYESLEGSAVVIITAGINELTGNAVDRSNRWGRLALLPHNAKTYHEIVTELTKAAKDAVIVVVTDPPDPLADITREIIGHNRVISAGTFLDSLRFRLYVAREFAVSASSVDALVVGEHGLSQVPLWTSARISASPIEELLKSRTGDPNVFRSAVETAVKHSNISIIEGNGASQFGIGMAVTRITEVILRDEKAVVPIGFFQPNHGVTLSLPAVLGRNGVESTVMPAMSRDENRRFEASANYLLEARQEFGV